VIDSGKAQMARSLTHLATRYRASAENGESGKCALVEITHRQKHSPVNALGQVHHFYGFRDQV
jgi:hypothetical protein